MGKENQQKQQIDEPRCWDMNGIQLRAIDGPTTREKGASNAHCNQISWKKRPVQMFLFSHWLNNLNKHTDYHFASIYIQCFFSLHACVCANIWGRHNGEVIHISTKAFHYNEMRVRICFFCRFSDGAHIKTYELLRYSTHFLLKPKRTNEKKTSVDSFVHSFFFPSMLSPKRAYYYSY